MIIPIKCFTCGKVLADKYRFYVDTVKKMKVKEGRNIEEVIYLTKDYIEKTPEGKKVKDFIHGLDYGEVLH